MLLLNIGYYHFVLIHLLLIFYSNDHAFTTGDSLLASAYTRGTVRDVHPPTSERVH